MTDDLTGLGKVGVRLIESGEKFLEKIVGPWLEEQGQALADGVRAKRRANLAQVAGVAESKVSNRPIVQIPGRVLFPLLEGASHEDGADLRDAWANLLASAADRDTSSGVLPGFPAILAQLSPLDVLMVSGLYNSPTPTVAYLTRTNDGAVTAVSYGHPAPKRVIAERISATDFNVAVDNLIGLRVCIPASVTVAGESLSSESKTSIHFTDLGRAFAKACHYE